MDNLRRILEPRRAAGFFVRIDMESSRVHRADARIFETLWQQEYRNIGVVLQSDLHRTERTISSG